jgi:hypothetical protein
MSAKKTTKTKAKAEPAKKTNEPVQALPAEPKAPKTKEKKPKKVSALDAAAKVLGEAGQPMNCMEMIEAMSKKGYWTSRRQEPLVGPRQVALAIGPRQTLDLHAATRASDAPRSVQQKHHQRPLVQVP